MYLLIIFNIADWFCAQTVLHGNVLHIPVIQVVVKPYQNFKKRRRISVGYDILMTNLYYQVIIIPGPFLFIH